MYISKKYKTKKSLFVIRLLHIGQNYDQSFAFKTGS